MKKKFLAAGVGLAAGAGVALAVKKKKENGDVIFRRVYPEKDFGGEVGKGIAALRDKLEDFQINVLCAADVPLECLKKTVENFKGEMAQGEETFRRFMDRSESKLSSELIRAQMNINAKRAEISEVMDTAKYENRKEKDAAKAKAEAMNAVALNSFALKIMDEAMAASVEAELLAKEYAEAYGESLIDPADEILSKLAEKEDEN